MLGALLGLGAAAAFALNNIICRRGMLRASSGYVANVSIFLGPPFFLLVTLISGDLFGMSKFTWQSYTFFAIAGIIHFAFGRTWSYKSLKMIGSTRSNIVTNLNQFVTVILAAFILKEAISPITGLGIAVSLLGPLFVTLKEKTTVKPIKDSIEGKDIDRRTLLKGMLYGVGTAICWGSSAIFIKWGLESGGPPLAGTLISYVAASIVVVPTQLLNEENKKELFTNSRYLLLLAIFAGVFSALANLLKYLGLAYGSVIVVALMGRTGPVWVMLLAFIFNRKYESFSRWVILSNSLLVVGTLLVLFG